MITTHIEKSVLSGEECRVVKHRCICTRVCDCEAPDGLSEELRNIVAPLELLLISVFNERIVALGSNECPVHNMFPEPHPECTAEQHWFESK